MAAPGELLSLVDNPVFRLYATYAAAVVVKMMFLSAWTVKLRVTRKVFMNLEDGGGKREMVRTDEDIERIRRCHRNDMENIPPFLVLGLLYVLMTGPGEQAAAWHFRVFAASRLAHTVAYLTPLPQPSRFLACLAGYCVNVSLAVQLIARGQL